MDLFEYQARDLFAAHGVPVLEGGVAQTAEEARAIAERLGGPVVVKAQVKTGGRGKAGGVKLADSPDAAQAAAAAILGMDIKGHTVHRVLVAEASDIAEEYYFSFLVDRANRTFLAMASREGGMEIERIAVEQPDDLAMVQVDPLTGVDVATARDIATRGGFPTEVIGEIAEVILALWEMFTAEDATLVEVNPLVKTPEGRVLALDGKVTLDDNAGFRHAEHAALVDPDAADPLEARAKAKHLNYVKLDGEVGIIGNGAGLVMSTLDVVAYAGQELAGKVHGKIDGGANGGVRPANGGARPANFLDIGGGASAQVMADGLEIIMSDPAVRSVFVNVFGGITACDEVANGIVQALALLEKNGDQIDKPIVVRLDGNNAALGRSILDRAGHRLVERVDTMDGAAQRAAELAAQGV